jgi:hypothetical protein
MIVRLSETESLEVALMAKIELIVVEDPMGTVRTKVYPMLEIELYQTLGVPFCLKRMVEAVQVCILANSLFGSAQRKMLREIR